MRQSESWRSTGDKGSHTVTVTSTQAVPKTASSLSALLVALNSAGMSAMLISPEQNPSQRPVRLSLGMAGTDTEGGLITETLYAVTPVQSDSNSRGVRVERLCAMQWTLGPTPLSLNGDSLLESKAVSITADDGVLEARTGKAAVAISREPATVEIFDTGDVLALLRVGQRNSSGGAASAVPLHRRWE